MEPQNKKLYVVKTKKTGYTVFRSYSQQEVEIFLNYKTLSKNIKNNQKLKYNLELDIIENGNINDFEINESAHKLIKSKVDCEVKKKVNILKTPDNKVIIKSFIFKDIEDFLQYKNLAVMLREGNKLKYNLICETLDADINDIEIDSEALEKIQKLILQEEKEKPKRLVKISYLLDNNMKFDSLIVLANHLKINSKTLSSKITRARKEGLDQITLENGSNIKFL
jgi:hypothetical protein